MCSRSLLTLAFALLYILAEGKEPDAVLLRQSIATADNDTSKVNTLISYAELISSDNPDSSAYFFEEARSLSQKLGFEKGMCKYYKGYNNLLNMQGKYNDGLGVARDYVKLAMKMKDKWEIAQAYNHIGNDHHYLSNLQEAAKYYMLSLKEAEAIDYRKLMRIDNNNLSAVFNDLREGAKAKLYAVKGYKLALELKDSNAIASSMVNLSNSFNVLREFDSAEYYLNECYLLGSKLKDYSLMMDADINLANVTQERKQFAKALKYYDRATITLKSFPSEDYAMYINWGKAEANKYLGNLAEAAAYAAIANTYARQLESDNELRLILLLQAEIHEENGDLSAALSSRKEYETLNDSLLSSEKQKSIHELDMQYQTEKKDKELIAQQLLLAQRNRQTLMSSGAAIIMVLIATIIFLQYRSKQRKHKTQLWQLAQDQELHLLEAAVAGEEKERNRIARDLHDGVGGLLSAAKMHLSTVSNTPAVAAESVLLQKTMLLVDEAAREVRKTAHTLMPEMLYRHGLAEALRIYCRNSSNDTLSIEFYALGTPSRFNSSSEVALYRMVQELVNNIIKHAEATEATVQLSQQESVLSITVEDNGVGMTVNPSGDHGVGLDSIRKRLEHMQGSFVVDSSPGEGTSIYMELDIRHLQPVKRDLALS